MAFIQEKKISQYKTSLRNCEDFKEVIVNTLKNQQQQKKPKGNYA